MSIKNIQSFYDLANRLRIHSIKATSASKSGHPTSCSSIAEIMAVLFFHTMRYKVHDPKDPTSDRLVLSKGHAAPILYAAWAEAGLFPIGDLLTLRKLGSDLEGHPTPRLRFVDVATGSLGQGLAVANGMAYVGKYYDKCGYRVYCLIGDGESAEGKLLIATRISLLYFCLSPYCCIPELFFSISLPGSIWESIAFASHYKLDNLCLIIDVNRLGQTEETTVGHKTNIFKNRLDAFGFHTQVVDGHCIESIACAFDSAATVQCQPTAIIAKTFKGKNFPNIENENGWHGKSLGDSAEAVVNYLQGLMSSSCLSNLKNKVPCGGSQVPQVCIQNIKLSSPPCYKADDKVATRCAYGTALAKIAQTNSRVISLDADLKNSTFAEKLKDYDPCRFIECFIAEQNMVGVAMGAACRDRTIAFASTFGAFFTRAYDQIRMGAISQSNVNFCGSHCGVSIGEDGPSQMALEDIAMFRTIPGCTIFYPSDAVACERAIELAANTKGITYIRTTRPATPVYYGSGQCFEVGKGIVLRQTDCDQVLVSTEYNILFELVYLYYAIP